MTKQNRGIHPHIRHHIRTVVLEQTVNLTKNSWQETTIKHIEKVISDAIAVSNNKTDSPEFVVKQAIDQYRQAMLLFLDQVETAFLLVPTELLMNGSNSGTTK